MGVRFQQIQKYECGANRISAARLRQQAIGVRLRQMFDEVVNEDVPDEFLEILRKHDAKTSEKGG